MLNKIARAILAILGSILGIGIAWVLNAAFMKFDIQLIPLYQDMIIILCGGIGFMIITYILSNKIIGYIVMLTEHIEQRLQQLPMSDVIAGVFGLIIGLIIAYLITSPLGQLKLGWLLSVITAVIYLLFGYLGISIATKRIEEISKILNFKKIGKEKDTHVQGGNIPKVLDTSVIIDGRIFDICRTGFVEGPLIIPSFVLEELRHIADSSDTLKRNRGRRGLDILNRIQKELEIPVKIWEGDIEEILEVDTKLLKLAQLLDGKVVTNDYNLNKVAEFQGVPVLNINELANAVKPVVLPGEEMKVQVIKDGKEMGQGVAYLDDGTMIVVDGGKKHVGESIGVMVTSVLQTAAGRMIFAKPKQSMDRVV
ncbi:MAG: PIN/TRAM domain-containing protein [Clostridiales bacterium]|nr:PIN/TRAM domain-containing protein [Clostridiales bacterium]